MENSRRPKPKAFTPAAVRDSARALETVDLRRWQALWIILLASFMDILDATVVAWPHGIGIASGASIRLAPHIGRPLLSTGALLVAAGMGAMLGALRLAGTDISPWQLVPGIALGGLGMGMIAPTLTDFVLAAVPDSAAGAASGVLNTIFQVGAAAGVAVVGVIFFGSLSGAQDAAFHIRLSDGARAAVRGRLVPAHVHPGAAPTSLATRSH